MPNDYDAFISQKSFNDVSAGFDVGIENLNPYLKPFQAACVRWALARGRAALFEHTGLGKTIQLLSWAHEVVKHTGGRVLILSPLCVSHQTVAEARKFGIPGVQYARSWLETSTPITVTNYEMLSDMDARDYVGVVLDESSILKNQTGKTRQRIIDTFRDTPYRLSCTATPAPNDHMELGSQSEFLGIMSAVEMLSMFFVHDGGETSKWRLKGHGVSRFWEWMATWAVVLRTPADLGFDGAEYELPALNLIEHVTPSDAVPDDGALFAMPARSLQETRNEQRSSIVRRCAKVAELVNASDEPWVVWCHLNAEADELERQITGSVGIRGSDSVADKEGRILGFGRGDIRVLVTKTSIAGFGLNWQHCHNTAYVGLSYSWESFFQSVRRFYRFGQLHPVNVHLIRTENEGHVRASLVRKEQQADAMAKGMAASMGAIMRSKINATSMEKAPLLTDNATGSGWDLYLGDCVKTLASFDAESIDYSIFSPPFASLYVYSNSDYDMGNTATHSEFYNQFRFCVDQLFRVLKPGRLLSLHCMNLPTSKQNDGFIGIRDFRGEMIRMFVEAGFIYHSEVCIWKDPVTAMQRTKALGLLWKQLKKDSAMSRNGIPDYLVTMRKPGVNPEPVSHTPEDFPVGLWQRYASPVWFDINQSDTLNKLGARDHDDERHICPLQLGVIRRALKLWTNPGDLVLTPFAGIGSELFVSLQEGRRAVGVELKRSYYDLACKNCETAVSQMNLF